MSPRFLRLMIFAISLVPLLGAGLLLWSSVTPARHSHVANFDNAANNWQLTAIDVQSQIDTVDPSVRAQRNTYWKRARETDLEGTGNGSVLNSAPGPYLTDAPEFPSVKGASWVIASFVSFHVFAIDPYYRLIYTEMNFRVDQLLKEPSYLTLSNGSVVDVDFPGGCVKAPSGKTFALVVSARQYFFQPGHKYLMQVVYNEEGGFFWEGKRWDISSGIVKPDDPGEIYRAQHGNSLIDGMTVPDLRIHLPSLLPDESEK